jgi:hypothetical protein
MFMFITLRLTDAYSSSSAANTVLLFCVARLHKQQIFLEFFKMLKKQSVRLDQPESGTVWITITVYGLNFFVSVGIFHMSSN